jgi:hypothetical protein
VSPEKKKKKKEKKKKKKKEKKRERSKRKEEKGADLRDFSFTLGGVLCFPLCPGSRL